MLNFSHLSLRRGVRELLQDVTCTIHAGQRVGITGANGVGKSSLFALIRGQLHPDAGNFSLPPNTVIAHVAQETPGVDRPAIDYVMDGDQELRALEQQIERATQEDDGEKLAHLYTDLQNIDGYTATSRAGKLMHGLGFSAEQEQTAVKNFSGGWRMRLNLAQALMCRSDLLLLDEPTNHLDLEAVIWLEDWLRSYTGTLLLISHDRDFLDRVTTHIIHIENSKLTLYTGNYSAFEVRRAEQLASQQALYEKQQREITHMHKFVERFRAKASKARQAQSRLKALERMEVISQAHVDSPFYFKFRQPQRLPSMLLTLDRADVGYGDVNILRNINMIVSPGDRIGLLGHNGAGKSTLIKLLAGELALQQGERLVAKDINVGYFAQHQLEQLDSQASPLLHLQRSHPRATEKELRTFLGSFAFVGDMATAPVAPLSGGEKARLVLALIVYKKPNLLLLDEPTNHLDLEMRQALSIALQEFEGAMVIVSHDRYLLRTITDNLLLVANGKVDNFDGDLDDYRDWVRKQNREDNSTTEVKPSNKKQQRQNTAEKRRQTQLQQKAQTLEKQLEQLTAEKIQLETLLADSSLYEAENKLKLSQLLEQQRLINRKLQEVEEQWLAISEELDAAK